MEQRQKPLKVRIGCEFTILKILEMHDNMTICLDGSQGNEIDEIVGRPYEEQIIGNNQAFASYTHIFIN